MTKHTTLRHLAQTATCTGLALTVAIIAACSATPATGTPPVPRAVPPIDLAQPARVETATFAMG